MEKYNYIPLENNDEFFDGFLNSHLEEVKGNVLINLAIPSEVYNRNGRVYPAGALESSIGSILLTQPLLLSHVGYDLPDFLDYQDVKEEFTKVNWKKEGF
jgi:hypothetical protein